MSFSFLGYVHTEPISIAFVFVPVLAAGYLMGVRAAAAVETFRKELAKMRMRNTAVTCSIGVISVREPAGLQELYHSADRLLREAKKRGKN